MPNSPMPNVYVLQAYIYFAHIQLSQVGEFSTIVCTSSSDTSIVLAIFNLWIAKHGFEVGSHLGNSATGHPSKPQGWRSSHLQSRPQLVRTLHRNTSRKRFPFLFLKQPLTAFDAQKMSIVTLVETAIYVATVDKLGEVLKSLLDWVKEHK